MRAFASYSFTPTAVEQCKTESRAIVQDFKDALEETVLAIEQESQEDDYSE